MPVVIIWTYLINYQLYRRQNIARLQIFPRNHGAWRRTSENKILLCRSPGFLPCCLVNGCLVSSSFRLRETSSFCCFISHDFYFSKSMHFYCRWPLDFWNPCCVHGIRLGPTSVFRFYSSDDPEKTGKYVTLRCW